VKILNERKLSIDFEKDGQQYLGILQQSKKSPPDHPLYFDGTRFSSWEYLGAFEYEGKYYQYGKELKALDSREALEAVDSLEKLLVLANGLEGVHNNIELENILFLEGGGFLHLENKLPYTDKYYIESFGSFTHPDYRGEKSFSYLIASLAYKVLGSGKTPFPLHSDEMDQRERIRKGIYPLLESVQPKIRAQVSGFIDSSLGKDHRIPSLQDWISELEEWIRQGTEDDGDDPKKSAAAVKKYENSLRLLHFTQFIRKHNTALIISGIFAAIFLFFSYDIVSNMLAPAAQAGMDPRQTLELYFNSIDQLDYPVLADLTKGNVNKSFEDRLASIHVISRAQSAYGGPGILNYTDWIAAGKPVFEGTIIGITDLEIGPVIIIDGKARVEAGWSFWSPVSDEEETVLSAGFRREDRYILEQDARDDWYITEVEVLSQEELGVLDN
jgi:hypothetical protein